MDMNCQWGLPPEDNDCFNGWHAYVTCINCDELSDSCIFEKPAEEQIRKCKAGA